MGQSDCSTTFKILKTMEPILVSRNSCNKFLLIIIINDTNRMSSGKQNDWQAKARVNYFKVLDLGISCTEEWIRTIRTINTTCED